MVWRNAESRRCSAFVFEGGGGIGEQEKWALSVQQFPMKAAPPMPIETALQASTLIMMLDSEISRADVDENSNITIALSDGRIMTVQGTNEEWEESWFLELPVNDPDRRSVVNSMRFSGAYRWKVPWNGERVSRQASSEDRQGARCFAPGVGAFWGDGKA